LLLLLLLRLVFCLIRTKTSDFASNSWAVFFDNTYQTLKSVWKGVASKAFMEHSFLIVHCNWAIFIFFGLLRLLFPLNQEQNKRSFGSAEPFFLILPSKCASFEFFFSSITVYIYLNININVYINTLHLHNTAITLT